MKVQIEPKAGANPGEVLEKLLGKAPVYPVRLAVTNVTKKPLVLLLASSAPIKPGETVTATLRGRGEAWVLVTDAAEVAARMNGGKPAVELGEESQPAKRTATVQTEKKEG